jgi:hypothetical protein
VTAILAFVFSRTGAYVLGGVALVACLTFGYQHVKGIGYAECRVDWEKAERAAKDLGDDARRDGARDVERGVRDKFDGDNN